MGDCFVHASDLHLDAPLGSLGLLDKQRCAELASRAAKACVRCRGYPDTNLLGGRLALPSADQKSAIQRPDDVLHQKDEMKLIGGRLIETTHDAQIEVPGLNCLSVDQ